MECVHDRRCDCVAYMLQRRPDARAPLTRCRAVVDVDENARRRTFINRAGVLR